MDICSRFFSLSSAILYINKTFKLHFGYKNAILEYLEDIHEMNLRGKRFIN